MAQSRLERVGTIYTRVCSLIKCGVMKEEDVPVWLDVYKAFPPKYEPRYDRPASEAPVRNIFYPEDVIRGKFQNEFANVIDSNMLSHKPTRSQEFIAEYYKLEEANVPKSELYDKSKEKFISLLETNLTKKQPKQSNEVKKTTESKTPKPNIIVKEFFQASSS